MKLAMHIDLANAILAYLGRRPHDEVRGLIDAMQGMPRVPEPKQESEIKEESTMVHD